MVLDGKCLSESPISMLGFIKAPTYLLLHFNPFHATGLFFHPLNSSENL